jgi:outer membrane protein assembly factor BamB
MGLSFRVLGREGRSGSLFAFPSGEALLAAWPLLLAVLGSLLAVLRTVLAFQRSRRPRSFVIGAVALTFFSFIFFEYADRNPFAEQPQPPRPSRFLFKGEGAGKWTKELRAVALASPLRDRELLLVPTVSRKLLALRDASGEPAWSLPLAEGVAVPPVLAPNRDRVFVVQALRDSGDELLAIDPGPHVAWRVKLAGRVESPPVTGPLGGRLYLGAGAGGAYGIDAMSGAIVWQTKLGWVETSPVIDGETLYVAAADGKGGKAALVALERGGGKELWRVPLAGYAPGTPVVVTLSSGARRVQLSFADRQPDQQPDKLAGKIVSIDPSQKKVVWSQDIHAAVVHGQPAYCSKLGLVLQGLANGNVRAFKIDDGATAWIHAVAKPLAGAPQFFEFGITQRVAILTGACRLEILHAATGKPAAPVRTLELGECASASTIADGQMYVASKTRVARLPLVSLK